MSILLKLKRGTRAALDALAASSGLTVGEPYLINDESRIAIGTGAGTYEALAKQAEIAALQTSLSLKADLAGATFTGAVTVQGAFTSLGINDDATAERLYLTDSALYVGYTGVNFQLRGRDDAGYTGFYGGNSAFAGRLQMYGSTHATKASDIEFISNNIAIYNYDFSVGNHYWRNATGSNTAWVNSAGVFASYGKLFPEYSQFTGSFNIGDMGTDAPGIKFDTNDYLYYNKVTNTHSWVVGGAIVASMDATGIKNIGGNAVLDKGTSQTLDAGFMTTLVSDGTISSGTYTPTLTTSAVRYIVNGGAFTLAAPASTSSQAFTMIVVISNSASAGAVTFTGFNKVTGDTLDTVNGNAFRVFITVTGGIKTAYVEACQ